MKTLNDLKTIKSIGNKQIAESVAKRTVSEIPAYKKFLATNGLSSLPNQFADLPLTSKNSYVLPSDHLDLLAGDDQTVFYHRSSSLNNSLYWPQPKLTKELIILFKHYLEQNYQIHTRKSVCIVGAYMGSWIGGQNLTYYLENITGYIDYPLSIFTPGNNVEEIVQFILKHNHYADQFIVFLCPSFIAYIFDAVEAMGIRDQFPFFKLRFLTVGESFTEFFREHINKTCAINEGSQSLFSIYGSADTGMIGAESLASITIRQMLYHSQLETLHHGTLPHLFHFLSEDAYIEEINEEIFITKWQGIPIVRYNLHDKVKFYSWKELRKFVLSHKLGGPQKELSHYIIEKAGENLPDIIALFGRSDSSLKLQDTFISEEILDHIMNSKLLSEFLTGHYRASVEYDNHDHQYLGLLLELKPSTTLSDELIHDLYNIIINYLCGMLREFKADYEEIYKKFDNDKSRQILRLNICQWPSLSKELSAKTKRRGFK